MNARTDPEGFEQIAWLGISQWLHERVEHFPPEVQQRLADPLATFGFATAVYFLQQDPEIRSRLRALAGEQICTAQAEAWVKEALEKEPGE
jgi:hypothetical protein